MDDFERRVRRIWLECGGEDEQTRQQQQQEESAAVTDPFTRQRKEIH
ncbi:hypothetical protein KIPB_008008, partial [Kipferlia bialata]|eukprot:g8008.t1